MIPDDAARVAMCATVEGRKAYARAALENDEDTRGPLDAPVSTAHVSDVLAWAQKAMNAGDTKAALKLFTELAGHGIR